MEADYGVKLEEVDTGLVKGAVAPSAALLDPEAQKALRITPDKGPPPSGERLERLIKADTAQVTQSMQRAGGGEEAETVAASAIGSIAVDVEVGDGRKPQAPQFVIPDDGDWPDPTPEMPMEYLREMAKGYEIKHNSRTKRETLVKRIMTAMYPDVE
jgi:hypothetical protein